MGQRATVIIVGLVMLGIGAAAGTFGYIWFVGGSGTPSQPISAPTLSLDTATEVVPVATQIAQLDAQVAAALAQLSAEEDTDALAEPVSTLAARFDALRVAVLGAESQAATAMPPTSVPEPTSEAADASDADALTGRGLFRIDTERTVVRFVMHEELQGQPKEVIGATDQVAGDIIVDFDNPANTQVGEIRINVRTLHTDSEMRDRAIRTEILESRLDEYEFTSFVPTSITGLPDSISLDQEISFEVTGDFTVRNITQPVTFAITGRMVTEERLDGVGTANITREMYSLTIPDAPGVANVSNEITLEIEFTARLVDE